MTETYIYTHYIIHDDQTIKFATHNNYKIDDIDCNNSNAIPLELPQLFTDPMKPLFY